MTTKFGDDLRITKPKTPIVVKTEICDELEYECMNLVIEYANALGLKIEGETTPPIDFSIAKKVEETILEIFEENGIELKYPETI